MLKFRRVCNGTLTTAYPLFGCCWALVVTSPPLQPTPRKMLLPLAAASMASLPMSVRAFAFAIGPRCSSRGAVLQQALGRCDSGGGCGTVSSSRGGDSRFSNNFRRNQYFPRQGPVWRRQMMEHALEIKPREVDVLGAVSSDKTPSNKLLFAPPKFTPTPYE